MVGLLVDTFVLSFPLPINKREADPDLELEFPTNLCLAGEEDTRTPWASIAEEASVDRSVETRHKSDGIGIKKHNE
jgi:hypothetical protein